MLGSHLTSKTDLLLAASFAFASLFLAPIGGVSRRLAPLLFFASFLFASVTLAPVFHVYSTAATAER